MSMPARVPAAARPSWKPRLQVVRSPEPSRSLVPFLVLCVGVLLAALVAALLLNTAMAVSSYRVHEASIQRAQLRGMETDLESRLESLGSPSELRRLAGSLGMVPAEATVYISVGSQTILGAAPAGEGN